jgi:uncharacterized protein (DUF1800 family)
MDDWKKLKHLYLRAGFGLRPEQSFHFQQQADWATELEKLLSPTHPEDIPDALANFETERDEVMEADGMGSQVPRQKTKELTLFVNSNWVRHMATTQHPLLEKMTLFWHGHFACHSKLPHLAAMQLNTLRQHALGNFKDLVNAIAKDPAMISYLDNQQNVKRQPNENFARELLELFTIGIGHYTEKDIKEAARAFTGWKFNTTNWTFRFVELQHDYGGKSFMGHTGNFNGEDIIDIILEHEATARFIVRKLYRFFVNPEVDEKHVEELAEVFYEGEYEIAPVMRAMLGSDWFYDEKNIGIKIKSPNELLAGMIRTFGVEMQPIFLRKMQYGMGQTLFHPPNVAGWAGDHAWIDNSTLMYRLNLPTKVFLEKQGAAQADLSPFRHFFDKKNEEEIINQLLNHLLQVPISNNSRIILENSIPSPLSERLPHLIHRITSLPEYQLC